jgi:hypothetical protein
MADKGAIGTVIAAGGLIIGGLTFSLNYLGEKQAQRERIERERPRIWALAAEQTQSQSNCIPVVFTFENHGGSTAEDVRVRLLDAPTDYAAINSNLQTGTIGFLDAGRSFKPLMCVNDGSKIQGTVEYRSRTLNKHFADPWCFERHPLHKRKPEPGEQIQYLLRSCVTQ